MIIHPFFDLFSNQLSASLSQHYLSRDALAPGWRSSKKINKFWKWLKLAKTIRFGFIVLFYIWEPWDVCWFSSDFHKMSIANHLLTKWNWMLWLVTDLRKTSWNSFIRVLKHHAIGSAGSHYKYWLHFWDAFFSHFVRPS